MAILQNYCMGVNRNLRRLAFIVLLLLQPAGSLALAAATSARLSGVESLSIQSLSLQAQQQQLGLQPGWLNLLHYKKNLWGGLQSQADDARFYLSADGAHDPQAELLASLRGFFARPEHNQPHQHAQCRFPARLAWLDQQLNFSADLPEVNCESFERWQQQWQASRITLLFPGMYLANPASMFGHTFIRFDQPGRSVLLSPTLSYAAAHDESDSLLLFSLKGIFGAYPGRFAMQPYYQTLREYSDIEQRDIWEYPLNLSDEESQQLIRHLWEVREIKFDYFFFRENCAFRLLALLDVAREGINMSLNTHPLYAIPVDTVRDVQQAGLIASRHYRPARHSKLLQMSQQMSKSARQSALDLAEGRMQIDQLAKQTGTHQLDPQQQAKALELASELLVDNNTASDLGSERQLALLSARSYLPADVSSNFEFRATPPETSHASARWQLSVGEYEQRRFYEIGLRPSFHDDLDPLDGFASGVSISALDTRLRWYEESQQLEFESLDVFTMRSLVPVEPWAQPLSRKISLQINRQRINQPTKRQWAHLLQAQFGLGYARQLQPVLFYALLNTQLDYSGQLQDNYAWYAGLDTGALMTFKFRNLSGQLQLQYQSLYQLTGHPGDVDKLQLGVQFNLARQQAVRLEYKQHKQVQLSDDKVQLSYLYYF